METLIVRGGILRCPGLLTEQRIIDKDKHMCFSKLSGYDFEIKYKLGKENRGTDAFV